MFSCRVAIKFVFMMTERLHFKHSSINAQKRFFLASKNFKYQLNAHRFHAPSVTLRESLAFSDWQAEFGFKLMGK